MYAMFHVLEPNFLHGSHHLCCNMCWQTINWLQPTFLRNYFQFLCRLSVSLIWRIFAFLIQILEFANHVVSFVQVRGSVPLYWSQTGIKYKPPPRIDRGSYLSTYLSKKHSVNRLSSRINNADRFASNACKMECIKHYEMLGNLLISSPDCIYFHHTASPNCPWNNFCIY